MSDPTDDYTADWTCDEDGRSNSSDAFTHLAWVISKDIRAGAAGDLLSRAWANQKARSILARLAHEENLRPTVPRPVDWARVRSGVADLIEERVAAGQEVNEIADTVVVYVQAQLHPHPEDRDGNPG